MRIFWTNKLRTTPLSLWNEWISLFAQFNHHQQTRCSESNYFSPRAIRRVIFPPGSGAETNARAAKRVCSALPSLTGISSAIFRKLVLHAQTSRCILSFGDVWKMFSLMLAQSINTEPNHPRAKADERITKTYDPAKRNPKRNRLTYGGDAIGVVRGPGRSGNGETLNEIFLGFDFQCYLSVFNGWVYAWAFVRMLLQARWRRKVSGVVWPLLKWQKAGRKPAHLLSRIQKHRHKREEMR